MKYLYIPVLFFLAVFYTNFMNNYYSAKIDKNLVRAKELNQNRQPASVKSVEPEKIKKLKTLSK
jgi:hypothetical protein